jgi:hypothetical protein
MTVTNGLTGLGIEPMVGRKKDEAVFSLVRFFWTSKRNEQEKREI